MDSRTVGCWEIATHGRTGDGRRIRGSRKCSTFAVLVGGLLIAVPACTGDTVGSGPEDPGSTAPAATSAPFEDVVAQVQEYADTAVSLDQAPGVIALVRVGDQVRVVTSGVDNVKNKQPMTSDHRFPIASVTKSMVAAVVMQVAEEKALALDDTVHEWRPGLLRAGRTITVEHLLSHRSGLPEYLAAKGAERIVRRDDVSVRALVRLVANQPLNFPPGSNSAYSNTNYLVLGLIVEAATGSTLEQNLETRIFEPAGMDSIFMRDRRSLAEPVVHGYADGKDVTAWSGLAIGWADGGVVSTAWDVSNFYRALLSGRLVAPETVAQMTVETGTVDWASYGLGIAVTDRFCGTVYGHQGRMPGYFTDAWTLESLDRQVVVMINVGEDSGLTGPLDPISQVTLCG